MVGSVNPLFNFTGDATYILILHRLWEEHVSYLRLDEGEKKKSVQKYISVLS